MGDDHIVPSEATDDNSNTSTILPRVNRRCFLPIFTKFIPVLIKA